MTSGNTPILFWVFTIVWIGLATASWWFSSRSKDVERKRRVTRWFGLIGGIVFIAFVVATFREWWVLAVVLPVVGLCNLLNHKLIRFCPSCGTTLYNCSWSVRMRYCSRCGASVGPSTRPPTVSDATKRD